MKGKITNEAFTRLRIVIQRCNTTTDSSCVNDSILSAYEAATGGFTLVLVLVNTNIDPT